MPSFCAVCHTPFEQTHKYHRRKTCSDACARALKSKVQHDLYNQMKSDDKNKNENIQRAIISKYVGIALNSMKVSGKLPKRVTRNNMESKIISIYNPIGYYTIKFRRRCITMAILQYGYVVDENNPYNDDVWFILPRSKKHEKIDQGKAGMQDVRGGV
jgi:hypothetical protein